MYRFVSVKYKSLEELPEGAVVGSAALRRQAQLLNRFPHLKVVNFRGNVQSRIRKLQEGKVCLQSACNIAVKLGFAAGGCLQSASPAQLFCQLKGMSPQAAEGQGGLSTLCASLHEIRLHSSALRDAINTTLHNNAPAQQLEASRVMTGVDSC